MPNNMGVIRYILAVYIVIIHFRALNEYGFHTPINAIHIVNCFFALSGFLISGSYLRAQSVKSFLKSRAWRLIPAYWLTVVVGAIGLCFVSSMGIAGYFSDWQFWKYLISNLGFLNFIEPSLPGVFTDNPMSAVNGALWTMKVELALCLTYPAAVWVAHKLKINPVGLFIFICAFSFIARLMVMDYYGDNDIWAFKFVGQQLLGPYVYFFSGVLCFCFMGQILRRRYFLLTVSIAIIALTPWVGGTLMLLPIAMPLLLICLSFCGKWGTWVGKRDNITYNIYLVHFPVIQLFHTYLRDGGISWAWGELLCLSITVVVALIFNFLERKIVATLRN